MQGNVATVRYPDHSLAEYSYDPAGYLVRVDWLDGRTRESAMIVEDVQYAPTGQPTSIVYGNGATTTFSYDHDALYRLQAKETLLDGSRLQGFTYAYDSIGNVTDIVDETDLYAPLTSTFEYDNVNRLTRAHAGSADPSLRYSYRWTYDPVGSITYSTTHGVYAYSSRATGVYANPHAPSEIGDSTLTYDKTGHLISDGTWSHAWNFKGWLAASESADSALEYDYDHEGSRVRREDMTLGEAKLYPSASYEIEGDLVYRHIMAGGLGRVATSLYDAAAGTASLSYHHTDHLGSTHVDTDAGGNVVEWILYEPYGWVLADAVVGAHDNPFKYTGKEIDDSTYLSYYGSRYLTPGLGVFTSQDPVYQTFGDAPGAEGRQQSILMLIDPQLGNSYAYARGNPIRYADPDGRFIPVLLGAWAITEAVLSVWDAFSTYQVLADEQSSGAQRAAALGGFVAGLGLPGGGYGKGSALLANRVGRFLHNVRVVDQATGLERAVYRGGNTFTARMTDVKLDARGMVTREGGVSINSSANWARTNFGSAYRVDSIPDGLDIIQTGKDHYNIVPTRPMVLDEYQALLNEIKTTLIE
ncbi:hypothetical protein EPN81_04125 [Patescibacteria group bacterium]|nr:MAG: hypothetical protein EPN81_04125 [Patescibacteria group bacterium]